MGTTKIGCETNQKVYTMRMLLRFSLFFLTIAAVKGNMLKVLSLRLNYVDASNGYTNNGMISVMTGQDITFEVIGNGLEEGSLIKLTTAKMKAGDDCGESNGTLLQTKHFPLKMGLTNFAFDMKHDDIIYSSSQDTYHICVKFGEKYIHQGVNAELSIQFYNRLLPIWLMIVLVTGLLCLSGLFFWTKSWIDVSGSNRASDCGENWNRIRASRCKINHARQSIGKLSSLLSSPRKCPCQ